MADCFGGCNPDWWNPCGVDRWNGNVGGWSWSRLGDWLAEGARAVCDGDRLRGGCSVGLGSLGEGGRLRAEGSVDIGGDSGPDDGVVPARTPSLGGGDKAEDGDERLEGLHLENDCVL